MKLLSKPQLNEEFGKIGFLDNPPQLIAKIDYVGGISAFDNILNGQSQKEYGAVIHLIKRPKGLEIKLAKNFSSNSIGLVSEKIAKAIIEHKESIIKKKINQLLDVLL